MRAFFQVAVLVALIAGASRAYGAESEPNNSPSEADSLGSVEGSFGGELATEDVDYFSLSVTGPNLFAIRALTESPIAFSVRIGETVEGLGTPKHMLRNETSSYCEVLVFVPDGSNVLVARLDRGLTDQSSEYPGFEEDIEYTLVWRVGAGAGSEPELSAETELEGEENDEVSFTPDATPNSGGELGFRMISTLWALSGATLDAETGEFHWVPGFTDAGDRQIVLVATEYPTGCRANHVGWSTFLAIDIRINNVN